MNEEKLKLNKKGYEDYLKELEKKEKELSAVRLYKGTDAIYQGDNWHDNPTLYQTEAKERALMSEIARMKQKIENIEIVENIGNEELVDIGDIVVVETIFSEDDTETNTFKLVGTNPDFSKEIPEISINSPLGVAIYHKRVGEKSSYKVQDNIFNVEIKSKQSELEEEQTQEKGPVLKKTK